MLNPHRLRSKILTALVALAMCGPVLADSESKLLGIIDFPTSGSKEAQAHFLQGVLYMHNFEYREAKEAFARAQEAEPDFAMAYWGEAMTYNHPLWHRQTRSTGVTALERLGKTPEERAAKAPTQREKDYLATVEILFGADDPDSNPLDRPVHGRSFFFSYQLSVISCQLSASLRGYPVAIPFGGVYGPCEPRPGRGRTAETGD